MNNLPPIVEYRLVNQKKVLAAEVWATSSTNRAWIGVYPLRKESGSFNVRYFEVESRVIEAGVDVSEDELLNSQTYKNVTLNELGTLLAKWLDDLNKLVIPIFCDYPI